MVFLVLEKLLSWKGFGKASLFLLEVVNAAFEVKCVELALRSLEPALLKEKDSKVLLNVGIKHVDQWDTVANIIVVLGHLVHCYL